MERHLRAIGSKGVDGIWLDMTIVGEGNCYCPRCRAGFARAYGREIPLSPADPSWPDFLRFRADIVEALYARLRQGLREAAPGLAFTNNCWGYPWSSGEMGSRAIGATTAADFLTGEAYSDWTGIRSTSILPIFLRSAAGGRPFESLIGTMVNTWDYTRKPKAYLAYEAFSVFAHGATVTVDDQPFHDGTFREIFRDISSARETVGGSPARYAAIYHSQGTKDRCADQRDFVKDICGAFRLLRDLRLPVDFLFDESGRVPEPREVPLLVLSGVTGLGVDEWRRLDGYMRDGGLVVAAGELGGDPDIVRSLAAFGLELGAARGEIIEPICETGPRTFFHNNLPAPHRGSGCPALFEVPVGTGALAWFLQPLFRHYAKEPSAGLRAVVDAVIARHCPAPRIGHSIPLKMDFSVVEGPDALYIHLLNPNVEPSEGRFERSFEYMEEAAPVHDLRILVRRERIGGVSTLREKSPVQALRTGAGWEIRVARVALWEIVKVELGPGGWTTTPGGAWR